MKLYAENPNNDKTPGEVFHGVFLHRRLETLNGFDIVHIQENQNIEEGIHDILVNIRGKDYRAKLFFWKNHELNLNRGLVVDPNDEKGMLEAVKAYNSKSNLL